MINVKIEQEQLFKAKIKGWELIGTLYYYFGYDEDNDILDITYLDNNFCYAFFLTKEHWNKLGINENNADFERVN